VRLSGDKMSGTAADAPLCREGDDDGDADEDRDSTPRCGALRPGGLGLRSMRRRSGGFLPTRPGLLDAAAADAARGDSKFVPDWMPCARWCGWPAERGTPTSRIVSATTSARSASDISATTSPKQRPVTFSARGEGDLRPPPEPAEADRDELGDGDTFPGDAWGESFEIDVSSSCDPNGKPSEGGDRRTASSPHAEILGECASGA
jgi:hypothetical protein